MKNFNNVTKEERMKIAKDHSNKMHFVYNGKINDCIARTKLYDDNSSFLISQSNGKPIVRVEDIDSVGAIAKYNFGKTCVLNFASFKHPGGGFIRGTKAQEECLCHESFLYNVLVRQNNFYDYNNKYTNHSMYLNRALYSPDVYFFRNDNLFICDVLTVAAPNLRAIMENGELPQEQALLENDKNLTERINFIKKIVENEKVETLILGAFGCGVFGQDPIKVSQIFKTVFAQTTVKQIIYAVPKFSDATNYDAFVKTFKNA